MELKHYSLNDIDRLYRQGILSETEVKGYLRAWNANPGHFTQAVLSDGGVRNFDPEKSAGSYRHLEKTFGLRLPPPTRAEPPHPFSMAY